MGSLKDIVEDVESKSFGMSFSLIPVFLATTEKE